MDKLRRVIGNTVISLLGQGVTWTSTLVLTIAYGRFLGDVKFGELYSALTFVLLIGFPIESGFNQQLTRDVAQDQAKAIRYTANTLYIKFVFWLILYPCILGIAWLFGGHLGYNSDTRSLIAICGVTLLSTSVANTMASLHSAFERVAFPVVGTVLEKGTTALIGIIVLHFDASAQYMAFILLGGSLLNMSWQTFWAVRLTGLPIYIDTATIRTILRQSVPFLVYGVIGVIYYRIDTILLNALTTPAIVGWYGAGYRLFDTMVFLPSLVISAIMYPIFSKLSVSEKSLGELRIAVEKSMNFLLFCALPIATGLVVAAPSIIGLLYHNKDFSHTVPVLQMLAPGLVFLYVNSVLGSTIMSIHHEKKITLMAVIALVFNLGLNLLLIRLYQHVGAALVTSLTELLLMILSIIFLPRNLQPVGSIPVALKALLASLLMGLAVWFLQSHHYGLEVTIPVALFVYLAVAFSLDTIPLEDIKALYSAARNKAGHVTAGDLYNESIQDAEQIGEDMHQIVPQALLEELLFEPTVEPIMSWRAELTNPSIPALPIVRLRDTAFDDDLTVPRRALRPKTSSQVLPFAYKSVDPEATLKHAAIRLPKASYRAHSATQKHSHEEQKEDEQKTQQHELDASPTNF